MKQIRSWAIFGPIMMLLTFFVALMKVTQAFMMLPLVAILSLIISYRAKMKGLAVSILLLSAITAYYYSDMSHNEKFWQVSLAMASALACLITALTSQETENTFESLSVESESRLDHLKRLDEKLKSIKKSAKHDVEDLQVQLSKAKHKILAQEEVTQILREELNAFRDRISDNQIKPEVVEEMSEYIDTLTREKELLQTTLSRLQKEVSSKTVS